jgi:oxygen-independent coproporphyrinogen III oxidase
MNQEIRTCSFITMASDFSLINKYNVPGPRYTSYPTVPHWKTNPESLTWQGLVTQTFSSYNNSEGICIYIHLPYCESLCTYCGCNTRITVNHAVETPYIDAVIKEWEMYLAIFPEKPIIKEIHLGGGTPTFFSPSNLERLITTLKSKSKLAEDPDFSFEGHPNNTSFEHLETLRKLGFNRVSFGVQDMDLKVQDAIHRLQPKENVSQVIDWSRELGYESVNIDLVYGLPFQTLASVAQTIDDLLEWKPDRIAYYSYAHVPWIKPGQRKFTEQDLPQGEEKRALYEYGRARLEEAGYIEIGMDHFALATDTLYHSYLNGKLHRNFMGYTTTDSHLLLGLGVSAISDSWTAFNQNAKTVEDYISKINAGEFAHFKGHVLTMDEIQTRGHIKSLMCQFKTSWESFDTIEKFIDENRTALLEMETDGLLILDSSSIQISELGKTFVRNVCMTIDPLFQSEGEAKFSQTV